MKKKTVIKTVIILAACISMSVAQKMLLSTLKQKGGNYEEKKNS